jgi:hypothetical protein
MPGEPKNIMLGDTSKLVAGDTKSGFRTVVARGDMPFSSADSNNGLSPPENIRGFVPKRNGFVPNWNGFTWNVGSVTFMPGGNSDVNPGGRNEFIPNGDEPMGNPKKGRLNSGEIPELKAACCNSKKRSVGDSVVLKLLPLKNLVVPEPGVITVPAGNIGLMPELVLNTFCRVVFNGP